MFFAILICFLNEIFIHMALAWTFDKNGNERVFTPYIFFLQKTQDWFITVKVHLLYNAWRRLPIPWTTKASTPIIYNINIFSFCFFSYPCLKHALGIYSLPTFYIFLFLSTFTLYSILFSFSYNFLLQK